MDPSIADDMSRGDAPAPPFRVRAVRRIGAAPEAVWAVVSNAGEFARFAEGIAKTEVSGPRGQGMMRVCTDGSGAQWTETCTVWEEGRGYRMQVQVDTYPWYYRLLIADLAQVWTVTPASSETILTLMFEGSMRLGFVGRIVGKLLGRRGPLDAILRAYEREIIDGSTRPR